MRIPTNLALIAVALTALGACRRPANVLPSDVANVPMAQSRALRGDCARLRSMGHVGELLQVIDQQRDDLLQELDLADSSERIAMVSESGRTRNLQENIQRFTQMVSTDLGEIRYSQDLRWNVGLANYQAPAGIRRNNRVLTGARILRIYDWTSETENGVLQGNPHLKRFVTLRQQGADVSVRFKRPASAMELCQLQKALVIDLELTFSPVRRNPRNTYVFRLVTDTAK